MRTIEQQTEQKLSWAETARAMAAEKEDWSAWDVTASDGIETVPWVQGVGSAGVLARTE